MSGKGWAKTNLFGAKMESGAATADPVTPVARWLDEVTCGRATSVGALRFVPLVSSLSPAAPDLLAHEALESGLLEIREKDGGVVQELLAHNKARVPVVVIEGETLIGARQNRMVARTVVIAPGATIVIPVGCVEQGRWGWVSATFSSGCGMSSYRMRKDAKTEVLRRERSGRRGALDQGRLWANVESELSADGLEGATASRDFHVAAEGRWRAAAETLRTIAPVPGQVGVMALHDGALVGLEVVGHASTWDRLRERVLTSFLPAASDPDLANRRTGRLRRDAPGWLEAVRMANVRVRPSPGMGETVDLETHELIGSGVWLGGRPAHLTVFAQQAQQ